MDCGWMAQGGRARREEIMCVCACTCLGRGPEVVAADLHQLVHLGQELLYHSCFGIAEMRVMMMIEGIDTAPAPANHSNDSIGPPVC